MSFLTYQDYKDSGIDWLGKVPKHWRICKVKHVSSFFTGWTPPTGRSDFYEGDNPWANISDLGPKILNETSKQISDSALENVQISKSKKGSLLFSFKLSIGQVSFAGVDMYTNEAIATFPTNDLIDLDYAYYAYPIFIVKNASTNIYGAKLLNQELIKSAKVALPTMEEQCSIANFLDHETAKIDLLIAEQEKLIELLKEKRLAIISHSVTEGLDPKVRMKDSGYGWLNRIPENWRIGRLKHIKSTEKNSFVDGPFGSNLKSEHFIEGGDVYVIESNFATKGFLELNQLKTISMEHFETINRSEVRAGDIVIAKIGAQYGKSSILPNLDKKAVVSGNSLKLTVNPNLADVKYVNWFLVNLKSLGVMEDIVNTTAQPALSLGELNNLPILIPPLKEQKLIVEYLDEVLNKFQSLIDEANLSIVLLQERRSALISAAVTGQIDVYNYESKEAA